MYAWGVILQPIKNHYNETNEKANLLSALNTGFLFSSGTVEYILFEKITSKFLNYLGPIASGLVNQFGSRVVVVGGGFITGIMYFVSIYATDISVIMGTYGVIAG